ncbi:ABC transporter ATP-binding protein [Oceanobacillus jeddahense]|uniref:ABC transporter ATP-binding protein/permease n=1 Tax=Oceanobacillus jeddahense TaxID=1462527 RepID=A0ABY5JUL9_9BACI|nr:ABC transporter ATP-binding protein [Oceanobacillus jeddahense]UUI03475.1 ABC transporter ATP-binding protein/permease [Oceanobacillus jeddahense]
MKIKKFISYYRPYKKIFVSTLFASLLVTIITLSIPLIIKYMTDNLLNHFSQENISLIYLLGGFMMVLIIIQFLAHIFVDYYGHVMGNRMEKDMSEELFHHIHQQPHAFFDNNSSGNLLSRLTHDLYNLSELYHHGPEDLLMYILRFVGAIIILSFISMKLTLVLLFFVPIFLGITWYFQRKLYHVYKNDKEMTGEINGFLENSLNGSRVTKAFTNEKSELEQYKRYNKRLIDIKKSVHKNEALYSELTGSLVQALPIIIIVIGSVLILQNDITITDLLTFILYITYITTPIQVFIKLTVQYREGISGFNRFYEILQIDPAIKNHSNPQQLKHVHGNIEFKNVTFCYSETNIINDLNLTINAGEYVAFVGPSGIGKSTIASLIPRFYDIQNGQIQIDGIDIKDMELTALRKHIGIVQQDVYMYSGKVIDNIKYGNPNADKKSIIEAAKQANAHDFIMKLPNGYDTVIGEKGAKLSGGQKQRLSIARVFLKNPKIVIFDEATSSLDNRSERIVQNSLERLSKNRTTIVIAHRLSTIRNADRIYVFSHQGIEEIGTHEELMSSYGYYRKMYLETSNVN